MLAKQAGPDGILPDAVWDMDKKKQSLTTIASTLVTHGHYYSTLHQRGTVPKEHFIFQACDLYNIGKRSKVISRLHLQIIRSVLDPPSSRLSLGWELIVAGERISSQFGYLFFPAFARVYVFICTYRPSTLACVRQAIPVYKIDGCQYGCPFSSVLDGSQCVAVVTRTWNALALAI